MNLADKRLTDVAEIREHLGQGADRMNVLVVTQASLHASDDEPTMLPDATSLQIEGYVLHPRRLQCHAVELVITDPDDADYVLDLIRNSTAVLGALAGDALDIATWRAHFGEQQRLGSRAGA